MPINSKLIFKRRNTHGQQKLSTCLAIKEIQVKTIWRAYLTLEWLSSKKLMAKHASENLEKEQLFFIAGWTTNGTVIIKINVQVSLELSCDPAMLLYDQLCPTDSIYCPRHTQPDMFTVDLFTMIGKNESSYMFPYRTMHS